MKNFVILDIETTGKYPLDAKICEIAAIKWDGKKIVEKFQSLVNPGIEMSEEVINIHHITNEMVAKAPSLDEVLPKFHEFCKGSHCVGHHIPFDMGFLALEFERAGLSLFEDESYCTSLLSRALIKEVGNHRLKTLTQFLKKDIDETSFHRALADCEFCLLVLEECIERASKAGETNLSQAQGATLLWTDYSMEELRNSDRLKAVYTSIESLSEVEIVYAGGSRPNKPRLVRPISMVRNPEGDFLVAFDGRNNKSKRFLLDKIVSSKL